MAITVSPSSATLILGQPWTLDVRVTDPDGDAAADTVVATVTLPDDSTDTAVITDVSTGHYRASYTPADVGRYIATVTGDLYGAAAVTVWVADVVTGTQLPDISELDAYLGTNNATDDELQEALDAEAAAQRRVCRMPATYDADLRSALLRRAARHLAMKRLTLAIFPSGDSEAGPTIVPGKDPEVRRLEAPYRKMIMG